MTESEIRDRIERFFGGKMPEAEKALFRVELEEEEELLKAYNFERYLRAALDEYQQKQQNAANPVQDLPVSRPKSLNKWYAVAASLALFIGLAWWFIPEKTPITILTDSPQPSQIAKDSGVEIGHVAIVRDSTKDKPLVTVKNEKKLKPKPIDLATHQASSEDKRLAFATLEEIASLREMRKLYADTLKQLKVQGYAGNSFEDNTSFLYQNIQKSKRKGEIDSIQVVLETERQELNQQINRLRNEVNIHK